MSLVHAPERLQRLGLTRRRILVDAGLTACALAIPVLAIITTARPIPNPPGRKAMSALSPAHQVVKEKRRAVKRERTRQAKQRERRKRPKRERNAE